MRHDSPSTEVRVGRGLGSGSKPLFVSVIVPVRNETKSVHRVLAELVAQKCDPERYEIIVVDGESTDDTPALVQGLVDRHENVRLLSNPRRRSSAGRNIGIRASRGDVVVIIDGHCEIEDDQFLGRVAEAFNTSRADCLGRPQPLDVSGASTLQRAIAAARTSRLGHHPESYVYSSRAQFVPARSVAVAYRRDVFDRIGYFDEDFDAHEDGEFNRRCDLAGLRCYFTPEIAVKYFPRRSLSGLFGQMFRYGRGRMRLMRKHPDTISIGTLIPAAFVLGLIIGLPLSFLSPWLAAIYGGALVAYLALVLLVSVQTALRPGNLPLLPWLPLVFATIHVGAGVGQLLELVAPPMSEKRRHPAKTSANAK